MGPMSGVLPVMSAAFEMHGALLQATKEGRLMELLPTLPRARWTEVGPFGQTLLHYACRGANVAAVVALLAHGLDVDARVAAGNTPAHVAAFRGQPRVLELLCAAGSDLRATNNSGNAPLDLALNRLPGSVECVRVLLANGVRLNTAREELRPFIKPVLEAFERGVLRCRSAVVAMLRVKYAGCLCVWDKFLMRQMALEIWATRTDKAWQSPDRK